MIKLDITLISRILRLSKTTIASTQTTVIGIHSPIRISEDLRNNKTGNDATSSGGGHNIERPNSSASSRSSGFHSAVEEGSCQPTHAKLVQTDEIPRPHSNRYYNHLN